MKKLGLIFLMMMTAFAAFGGGNKQAGGGEFKVLFYFPAPHSYFNDLQTGSTAWVKDTGNKVTVEYGPEFSINTESEKVNALVAANGFNAITIYPLPGVNGLFEELTKRGINIINIGADSSTSNPKGTDTTAAFCLATDVRQAAYDAAITVIDKMGGKGTLLNILEVLTDPNTVLRQEGVKQACTERGITYRETAGIEAIDAATQKATDILTANPDAMGVVSTGMIATQGLISVLDGMNRQIFAVTIDTEEGTLNAIKKGTIYGTVAQNPYGQTYLSLEILKAMHDGAKPRPGKYFIDSGTVMVTKDNVDSYANDINAMTQKIKNNLYTEYLTK
ncbi:sugar ABC transporter substrate-binding protein [Treponema primitia]|uniref:sugar ABC transporter substrate-binding protein n=1 Tax=Treponema primitia TaxID=88058 RepID=UPI00025553C3|nr:sugar ABC transporter substrate-binding protein [Treponema primitia]